MTYSNNRLYDFAFLIFKEISVAWLIFKYGTIAEMEFWTVLSFFGPALACVMIRSEYRNCTIKQKISEYQSKKKTGDNPGRKLGIKYRNFGAYIE
jgi:hypothetical protein